MVAEREFESTGISGQGKVKSILVVKPISLAQSANTLAQKEPQFMRV